MFSPPLKVLVVDDEPLVLCILTRILKNAGYQVYPANSSSEALGILVHTPSLDAVILDRAMPEMDGEELAKTIRAGSPTVPIIMVSGNPDAITHLHQLDATLAKPFHPSELLNCLKRVLHTLSKPQVVS